MNDKDSKYDSDGKLKTYITPTINNGDRVYYLSTILVGTGRNKKRKKIKLSGIWDGEKVQFDDEENTVVRNKRWLTI